MKTYKTNSIWGIEPRETDSKSKSGLDCKCSRCNEIKENDVFIQVWGKEHNYKYCEDCSQMRFECDYEFKTVR